MDVASLLGSAIRRLEARAGGRADARLEAEVLLAHVLGASRASLLGRGAVSPAEATRFEALVTERRETGRPVAYQVGRRAFHDLELEVTEGVLVPRPETEHVVEALVALAALPLAHGLPEGPVVDRGTGSGAIALALAGPEGCPGRRPMIGLERSGRALEVARRNVAASGRRVPLVQGDGLAAFRSASLAAVVANPPYVSAAEFERLPDDVRLHEPREALVPDEGSVAAVYTRLGREALRVLRPGGWLVSEVGAGQAADVCALLDQIGFQTTRSVQDLAGHERVVLGRKPGDRA